MMHVKPDFLIIGSMKSGTTTLFQYLRHHPEINCCKRKEPHYFSKNWDKGPEWYDELYDDVPGLKFEASTGYTKYPLFDKVPERIASVAPDVKLIFLVRHPVKRVTSHIHHNMITGRMKGKPYLSPEFWNGPGKSYINYSRYFFQLEQYLKYFSPQQILVLSLEEMTRDKLGFLTKVADFLEIEADPLLRMEIAPKNVSEIRLTIRHGRMRKYIGILIKKGYVPKWIVERISVRRPEIPEKYKRQIWESTQSDIEKLEKFLGRSLNYSYPG